MSGSILNLKISKQPSLRQIVYEKLKDAILTGALAQGTRIYESRLAEEMGISRTPVREALHILERETLIFSIDKVGYEVKDIDKEDLEEISEIRKTVETLALKEAIKHLDIEEIRKLENNLHRSEKILKNQKPGLFVVLDAEFHSILCSMSGRNRLIRMADTLRKEMQRFRSHARSLEPLAEASLNYHKKIVHFLKESDYRNASKILANHIDQVKKEILKDAK